MKTISILFTAALISAATVSATPVTLVNAGNPSNLLLGNIYVSPYTLTVYGQNYAAMCIDFADESYVGTTWDANVTSVASNNFSATYHHADANVAQEYDEEAYLYSLITQPNISSQNRTDIQEAAWEITDSAYTATSDASGVQSYINQATTAYNNNFAGFNFSGYEIISSSGGRKQQEYLIATPEPGSLTLLGAGLLIAGLFAARQHRKRFAKVVIPKVGLVRMAAR